MFREMRRNERQLSDVESMAVLKRGNFGVLSTFGSGEYPYGVPIHYVYVNGCICFHSAVVGHKIDNINHNSKVSFCVVDNDRVIPASFTTRYRSIVVYGRCTEVRQSEEKFNVMLEIAKKYAPKYAEAGVAYAKANITSVRTFQIEIEQITGKANATASCKTACPAGVNIPGYIALIKEGREQDAYNLIRQENPFPAVCGRICVHLCESKCVRGEMDQAVAIRQLKRYAADCAEHGVQDTQSITPANGKKVGIIGAGPSGLTCGHYLARLGYEVEIFEALSTAGGVMAFGIPEYKLPKEILRREIRLIEDLGVKIHLNAEINQGLTDMCENFDAVYVAVGSQLSGRLNLPGEDLPGVHYGIDFLRDINLHNKPMAVGENVVVVGGGNVAFDVARVAKRLGAKSVSLVCLESRESMPAFPDEITAGEEEGVVIHNSKSIKKILNDQGRITGIECADVESFGFDENKRLQVTVCEGSDQVIGADTIIIAIGQQPDNVSQYALETTHNNRIQVNNQTLATSKEGVFAGGDAVRTPDSVIAAIADGKKAAISIDQYLGGTGELNKGDSIAIPEAEEIEELLLKNRPAVKQLDPEMRTRSFDEINMGFNHENAIEECERCLRCDR